MGGLGRFFGGRKDRPSVEFETTLIIRRLDQVPFDNHTTMCTKWSVRNRKNTVSGPRKSKTSYTSVHKHAVEWHQEFVLGTIYIEVDRETNVLHSCPIDFIVKKEDVHGKRKRVGIASFSLSDFAGAKTSTVHSVLKDSPTNAILEVQIDMKQISGAPSFKLPSTSFNGESGRKPMPTEGPTSVDSTTAESIVSEWLKPSGTTISAPGTTHSSSDTGGTQSGMKSTESSTRSRFSDRAPEHAHSSVDSQSSDQGSTLTRHRRVRSQAVSSSEVESTRGADNERVVADVVRRYRGKTIFEQAAALAQSKHHIDKDAVSCEDETSKPAAVRTSIKWSDETSISADKRTERANTSSSSQYGTPSATSAVLQIPRADTLDSDDDDEGFHSPKCSSGKFSTWVLEKREASEKRSDPNRIDLRGQRKP